MKIYALTGGIAAGKSEASRRFEQLGIPVIDSDSIGHEALETGGAAEKQVLEAFGDEILTEGRIDREKLAAIVFADPEALERLNRLVHPAVLKAIAARTAKLAEEGHDAAIIEAALHAEDGKLREGFAGLIVIHCPPETRIRRLMKGRGMSEEEASRRIEAQTPPETKLHLARWVIMNTGDIAHLHEQVDAIAEEL
ncbi:MAG: dephospho-CoA kinase [Candidatus Hydrogenedentes bacterium]|nr:dephospho-CoA kinase [Candidatus Hydrogenedentota bacterium]